MKGTEKNSVKGCKSIVTESFLFGAQTIIYLSLFLIIAVDKAVKFVFAINIKKKMNPVLGNYLKVKSERKK